MVVLSVASTDDYFVNLMEKRNETVRSTVKKITRKSLPKIDLLMEWRVVEAGDILVAKGTEFEAELLKNGNVRANGIEKSLQIWLKEIYGWSSVQTYAFAIQKKTGLTLSKLREDYMMNKDKKTPR